MKKKVDLYKPGRIEDLLDQLEREVEDLVQAARQDEMKGGGDPASYQVIELKFQLAEAVVTESFTLIRREVTGEY